jgi:hypothetical protein
VSTNAESLRGRGATQQTHPIWCEPH